MSNQEIGAPVLTLSILIASGHILGCCFERPRQLKSVGKILADTRCRPLRSAHPEETWAAGKNKG